MSRTTMTAPEPVSSSPSVSRPHSFGLMRSFNDEVDRLFREFAPLRWPLLMRPFERNGDQWSPRLEVLELENRLIVRAELAGIPPSDVTVEVRGDTLCISGERRHTTEKTSGTHYQSEREYGRFERIVGLPDSVTLDSATATFDQGVLEVTFETAAPPAARRLPVVEKTAHAS